MIGRRPSRRPSQRNSDSPSLTNRSSRESTVPMLDERGRPAYPNGPAGDSAALSSDSSRNTVTQAPHDPFELFAGSSFSFDATIDYGSLDLDLSGEGLDIIPLPTVIPSLGQNPHDIQEFIVDDDTLDVQESGNVLWRPRPELPGGDKPMLQAAKARGPSVNEDNRQLIQHYLEVMKGYAKVDDRSKDTNNLFISAFSKSLSFPPLFYAILSFSASHLSMEAPSYNDQAEIYEQLADDSFNHFRYDEASTMDALLSALFVRVKKIHVTAGSLDTFFQLIHAATDIVQNAQVQEALADPNSLIRRIVIRLAILDARASHYGLGGGELVRHLSNTPALSFIFEGEDSRASMLMDVSSLLRADAFRMRVAEIDMRIQEQLGNEFATLAPVRTAEVKSLYKSIQHQIVLWENQPREDNDEDDADIINEEQSLSSVTYGRLTILSALHSALLYLYSVYVSSIV